ncbi:MAG: hypothetical protein IJS65_07420, partial [Clostridia bacterium]|nr:hypothetical protein [Clostridia bacterium]
GELYFRSENWNTVYSTGTVRMRKGCLGAVNVRGAAIRCRDFIFDGRDADRTFINHQSEYNGNAVYADGTVTFKSGKITLFSKSSYAVESAYDVNFDGAYVRAISDKENAVKSRYGNINVNAGTVSATAGGDHRPFFTASQGCGLRPSEDMRITTPEAGFIVKYDGGNYSDLVKSGAKPGVIPTDVDFESIPLEGSISINKTVARAGDELSINYHFDNVTAEATVCQEWQRSEDGVNWVTFDTVTTRYKVKAGDRGYYIRGVISEVSRCGKLCSPACFITTQTELSGGIVYTSAVRYTSPLSKAQTARTGLLGDLEKGANASSIIHYQWQRSADGVSGWTDIPKSESASALTTSYSVGRSDVNHYIRLKATVDGYTGAVVSSPKYVGKLAGAFQPDNYATLSCPDPYNYIYVTNAKTTQEYICSKSSTAPADWSGAFSPPSDGAFGFVCDPDTFYYVHTRNKETAYKEASGSIYTSVYTGSAPTVLKGLKLSKTSYRTKVGDSAFQLSVTPLPSDYASWNTATVRWFVNGGGVKLYTDIECTQEINGTSNITEKVVYARPVAQAEHVYVGVEKQVGYNDVKVAQCKVDVADGGGNYILHSVSFDTLELFPGDSAVVSYRPSPSPAVVGALSFKKNDGIMPESELSLTDNGDGTVTVTAPEDCIEGTYYYKVTIADAPASSGYLSYIKVNVSLPEATVSFDDGTGELYDAGLRTASAGGLRKGMDAQTVPLGSEFILPENGFPVPDGYEFDGWDLGNSGDGINVTEDVVVAAVWRKHTHSMTYQEAKPSGCLTPGRMEHWYCEDCGKVYGDEAGLYPQEDIFLMIPAAGHHSNGDPVTENEIPATCLTAGSYDTVVYCTVCGEEISREHTDVKATGHTPGEEVRENTVQPTCADDGSYDEVRYCTVCGKEASRTTKSIPALGHDMTLVPAQASTCEVGGVTQHYVCSVCGGYFEDEYGSWEILDHHDVEGDPLDHELGEVSYEWAPDDSYVTASALCEWGHEVSETAFTKLEVLTPPSEYSDGEGKLTARFANPTFAEVEKTVTIPRGQVIISGGVSGDLLSYEVTDAPNESLLIAARYDNGKLTCVRFIYSPQTGAETMSGTGDTFKLMLLDENYLPMCEAWVG